MTSIEEKLQALRARLLAPGRKGGALLVIYRPEDELAFRSRYREVIMEVQARGLAAVVLDLRTLAFEVLEERGLLQKAFQLDASNSLEMHRNLAGMVQREALARVRAAAAANPEAILFCQRTASLYPWISYSSLLEESENTVLNTLVLPFPGREDGPALHFMGVKDGYNYRAGRV